MRARINLRGVRFVFSGAASRGQVFQIPTDVRFTTVTAGVIARGPPPAARGSDTPSSDPPSHESRERDHERQPDQLDDDERDRVPGTRDLVGLSLVDPSRGLQVAVRASSRRPSPS